MKTKENENYIDHEVRIRVVELGITSLRDDIKHIDNKMDSHFKWVLGTIIAQIALTATLFGGIILHLAKLI